MAEGTLLFIALALVLFFFLSPVLLIVAWMEFRRRRRQEGVRGAAGEGRLAAIENRISEIEVILARLAATESRQGGDVIPEPARKASQPTPDPTSEVGTTATPPTAAVAPDEPHLFASHPAEPMLKRSEPDLENVIAGRWLNHVGIVAILLASFFFAKYAFDNDWVGPTGQLTLLIVAGVGLLLWSERLLRHDYPYFSEGIAALGAALLYLALWAGWSYYALLPQKASFFGMTVVTAGMAALAFGRDSQRIALIALAGGFSTPLLVSTGTDQQTILFTYLLVLNAGMLLLSRAREWKALEWLAFFSTLAYFWGWHVRFYDPTKLFSTTLWATAFFAQFAALPVLRSRALGEIRPRHVALVLGNVSWYMGGLHLMLWAQHRWTLTLIVLGLAVAHLAVALSLPQPFDDGRFVGKAEGSKRGGAPLGRVLFAGLALTFATLAIPIRLEGEWITIAWALEGGVLVASGFAYCLQLLRWAGLFLFGLTVVRLMAMDVPVERFLFNTRFATFLVAISCFVVALMVARAKRSELGRDEASLFAAVGVAANVMLLWALSLEVWNVLGRQAASTGAGDVELGQQLGLSLLWVVYAGALTAAGFRAAHAGLRWQGILLFGLVVGKVFLYDLSFLERFYRIVSFMILGTVLLGVSFFYQRRLAQRQSK